MTEKIRKINYSQQVKLLQNELKSKEKNVFIDKE
jgi:hypothetical protein